MASAPALPPSAFTSSRNKSTASKIGMTPSTRPVSLEIPDVPVVSPVIAATIDYQNRVYSDEERSDHGVPIGYRKPPPPQSQPHTVVPQTQQKPSSGAIELPSPDFVSSDNSLSNAVNRQNPLIYQDQGMQIRQVQDFGYILQPQYEQP